MKQRRNSRLSETEIRRRTPVWTAMSELFLDSEIDRHVYSDIARTIADAGYFAAFARHILEYEVFPVFFSNLLSVAEEWKGWKKEDVRDFVISYIGKSTLRRAVGRFAQRGARKRLMAREWPNIARLL